LGIKKKLGFILVIVGVVALILYLLWRYARDTFMKLFGWTHLFGKGNIPSTPLIVYSPGDMGAGELLLSKIKGSNPYLITDFSTTTEPAAVASAPNVILLGGFAYNADTKTGDPYVNNYPTLVCTLDTTNMILTGPGVYANGKRFIGTVTQGGRTVIAIYGYSAVDTLSAVLDYIDQNGL